MGTDVAVRYYLRKGDLTGDNIAEGTTILTTTNLPVVGNRETYYVVPVDKCGGERPDLAYSFTLERKLCERPGMGSTGMINDQNKINFRDPTMYYVLDSTAPNAQRVTPDKNGVYDMPHNTLVIGTASVALTRAYRFEIHKDDGTLINPNNGTYLGSSDVWKMSDIASGPSINGRYTMYMYDVCGNVMASVSITLQKQ